MRIISGSLRGLKLAEVGEGDAKAHLRPTSDRVRESLFNVLASLDGGISPVVDARVLDLFAGTGALGFEALSRGAAQVTFVDEGVKARALIRENIDKCRAIGTTRLLRRDATDLKRNDGAPFKVIFLDPPYGKGLGEKAIASAQDGGWIAPGALLIWEENAPQSAPAGFTLLDQRKYGDTWITLLRAPAP